MKRIWTGLSKVIFLGLVLVLSVASLNEVSAMPQDSSTNSTYQKPNIIVLFSDDAGYADFGFQPNVRPDMAKLTPNIDSIAKGGVRFSNAYMSGSVCSPSRAGLMTGRYQQRFGHDNNIPPGYMKGGLPLSETFVAKRLKGLGYRTGLIGKWHLGYPEKYQPNDRGFDWFYGCLQGSRSYFPMKKTTPHRVFLENKKATKEGGYTTDRIGDGAIRFIKESKEKPFYLFVSFTAPHGPLQAKKEDLEKLSHIKDQRRRRYAGLVKTLDDNVGRILKTLKEEGLDQNTLIVFTNDNGGQTQVGANNYPLKGKKGSLWEGGIRVPMAASWPGKIPAGSVIEQPVISLDLAPSFISAAGGKVDKQWNWDGLSLEALVDGKTEEFENRTLFWRRGGKGKAIAARNGRWKLYLDRSTNPVTEHLFDLKSDSSEAKDVSKQRPGIVLLLKKEISKWESELKEPLWNSRSRKKGKKKKS